MLSGTWRKRSVNFFTHFAARLAGCTHPPNLKYLLLLGKNSRLRLGGGRGGGGGGGGGGGDPDLSSRSTTD